MKNKIVFLILFLVIFCISCKPIGGCYEKSITHLVVRGGGRNYIGTIINASITFKEKVSCDVDKVVIINIELSNKATTNKVIGDSFEVNKSNVITVTSCDGASSQDYTLLIESEACSGSGLVLGRK